MTQWSNNSNKQWVTNNDAQWYPYIKIPISFHNFITKNNKHNFIVEDSNHRVECISFIHNYIFNDKNHRLTAKNRNFKKIT